MWKLAIVDDHELLRIGLRACLAADPDLQVVGEAADAETALERLDSWQPDVAVVDVLLPGLDGISAARELRRRRPSCELLLISGHPDPQHVVAAIAAGARGYVVKSQLASEVREAVRSVARGETWVGGSVADPTEPVRRGPEGLAALSVLTARERDVFHLLVRGLSNARIAAALDIRVRTVETHRAHLLKKLRLHSLAELIRFAARHALFA